MTDAFNRWFKGQLLAVDPILIAFQDSAGVTHVVSDTDPLPVTGSGSSTTGTVTLTGALPAGGNAIGSVIVTSLPPISVHFPGTIQISNIVDVNLADGSGNLITSTGGALDVNILSGSVVGTEYTEGDVDATIVGGAILWEDVGNTLRAVSAAKPLPISDAGGSLTVDGVVSATQGGNWSTRTLDGVGNSVASTGGALNVHISSGSSAGTEYTEGATDATITGSAILWEDTGDTLRAVSAAKPLPISDAGGSLTVDGTVAATQSGVWNITTVTNVVHVDDNGASLTVDGTVAATQSGNWSVRALDGTGNALTSTAGSLDVNITGGASAGTEYTEGATDATITGSAILWEDSGDTLRAVSAAKPLPIGDAGGSLTVDGTVAATQSGAWNITTVTNVVHVDDNSGSLTVDGTVAATQSGTWNIGTVATVTNVVHVDDNAGSLTVDGTVAATQSGTWSTRTLDGTGNAITSTGGALDVNVLAGGSSGTEYTEGATDATITGTAILWEDTGDTLRAVSAAKPLPISDAGGSLTVDGTVAATQSGTWSVRALDGTGNALTSTAGSLDVNVTGGSSASTEYTEGDTDASITGVAILWEDAADTLSTVSAAKPLPIGDAGGSLTVDGTVAATQSGTWNITTVTNVVHVDDNGGSLTVDGTVAATQSGTWNIGTLSTITNVVHIDDNAGSLTVDGTVAITGAVDTELPAAGALADAASATPTTPTVGAIGLVMNATTVDRQRAIIAAMDSTGTGIAAAGLIAQLDDVATAAVTENQFAPVRLSSRRALLVEGVASGTAIPVSGTLTGITNVVHVDDNAGSLTVDGTVAATQSGTWNVGTLTSITNVVHVDDNAGSLTVDGSVSITGSVDTELNAAAALADAAAANVSTATVGAVGLVMNATTLDRQRAVIAAMDSTGTGIAAAGLVGQLDDTGTASVTENQFAPVRISTRRALLVEGVASGTAIPTTISSGTVTTVSTVTAVTSITNVVHVDDNSGSLTVDGSVSLVPLTSGGLTTYHLESAASTNATVVKNSAGQLYGYYIYNANAAMRKVAFHNASSAPTAGASIFFTVPIPPGSAANCAFEQGIAFSTGIAITTVTTLPDNGSTGVAADDLNINLFYK